MNIDEFDYYLPKELIAQFPCQERDNSKLMVLDRQTKAIEHKNFFNIIDLFNENDVLVINNTKVIPARLIGKKLTGAVIEIFLLERKSETQWETLIKPSKRIKSGSKVIFSEELQAKVINRADNDKWLVEFEFSGNFDEILDKIGNIPLPPYISRRLKDDEINNLDDERYQTVYAQNPGSVAAPTAGLHFTVELLDQLKQKGVEICSVTLNVGLGTFKPVKVDNILEHKIHKEFYEIPEETANIINLAKQKGKNVVAVGTTTVRTLEYTYNLHGKIVAAQGWCNAFIYPGYKFNVIDKLITNFHLPKSTLIMLVSAFAGKDYTVEAYKQAIENDYRFYSYGDCMLIN